MTDDVPVSRTDGPGQSETVPGAAAVGSGAAQQMEPASLGPAFPPIRSGAGHDRRPADQPQR
jgi:hypothetical protein